MARQDDGGALLRQGFAYPLLQVPLVREGRSVLAYVFGSVVQPTTGQVLLDDMVKGFPNGILFPQIADVELRLAVEGAVASLIPTLGELEPRRSLDSLQPGNGP
jgi:hypothetical protein